MVDSWALRSSVLSSFKKQVQLLPALASVAWPLSPHPGLMGRLLLVSIAQFGQYSTCEVCLIQYRESSSLLLYTEEYI